MKFFRHRHHWRDQLGEPPPAAIWGAGYMGHLAPFYCGCGAVGRIENDGRTFHIVEAGPNDPVRHVTIIEAVPMKRHG